jgi:hypothetical protein
MTTLTTFPLSRWLGWPRNSTSGTGWQSECGKGLTDKTELSERGSGGRPSVRRIGVLLDTGEG